MNKNAVLRKSTTVGIFVLLFGITVIPSITAEHSSIRVPFQSTDIPSRSENQSYWNFTLPTASITYDINKWKWGVVEFDDFDPMFDLNYSSFGTAWVNVGFNQTVYCFLPDQLLPARYEFTIELFWNGSFFDGIKLGTISTSKLNWTSQLHLAYFAIRKEVYSDTDIQGRITITGYPSYLHFLSYFTLPRTIFWWLIDGRFLLPYEQRHGTTAEFTLHVHG